MFTIKVFDSSFYSAVGHYMDGEFLKSNKSEPFQRSITILPQYQNLILKKSPTYTFGDEITGSFHLISEKYYNISSNPEKEEEENTLDVRIYFTCELRKGFSLY